MEKYSIYKLQRIDYDKLVPLMKDCFGMNVDLEYFKWKYLDNPAGFVEGYYAMDNESGEIAAYYGGIPQIFHFKNKKFKVIQSCDTMTHTKHRRKGLFELLARYFMTELEKKDQLFIIGFGGSNSVPGFIKFGWRLIFDVRNYFLLPLQINVFYKLNSSKYFFYDNVDLNDLNHLIGKCNEINHDALVVDRSIKTYRWRIKNPLHNYRISGLKTDPNKKITSFVVYYYEDNKIVLFDFYFANKYQAQSLLKNIYYKISYRHKINGIISFCQTDSYWSSQLSCLNFLYNPFSKGPLSEKMYFVIYTKKNEEFDVFSNKTWNLNSYDHDSL